MQVTKVYKTTVLKAYQIKKKEDYFFNLIHVAFGKRIGIIR